jgi:hypothetical protein
MVCTSSKLSHTTILAACLFGLGTCTDVEKNKVDVESTRILATHITRIYDDFVPSREQAEIRIIQLPHVLPDGKAYWSEEEAWHWLDSCGDTESKVLVQQLLAEDSKQVKYLNTFAIRYYFCNLTESRDVVGEVAREEKFVQRTIRTLYGVEDSAITLLFSPHFAYTGQTMSHVPQFLVEQLDQALNEVKAELPMPDRLRVEGVRIDHQLPPNHAFVWLSIIGSRLQVAPVLVRASFVLATNFYWRIFELNRAYLGLKSRSIFEVQVFDKPRASDIWTADTLFLSRFRSSFRFAFAHELAHVILETTSDERKCDRYAALVLSRDASMRLDVFLQLVVRCCVEGHADLWGIENPKDIVDRQRALNELSLQRIHPSANTR